MSLGRQMFQETQQEVVGYGSGTHEGNELLDGLQQLGYSHCNLARMGYTDG